MQLNASQIDAYHENGYLILPSVFDEAEINSLLDAMNRDSKGSGPHRIIDDDSQEFAALYASQQRMPEFSDLVRSARMLCVAQALLNDDVYLYQLKINVKSRFGRSRVSWHQDYVAWKIADGLPDAKLVNVALLLDDSTEFNGPLLFVPGSHTVGVLRGDRDDAASGERHLDPDDIALQFEHIGELISQRGMTSAQAPAGSLVLFSPQLVHSSAPNMSATPRRLLIATYNSCSNLPRTKTPRPNYLVNDDPTPLRPLADGLSETPEKMAIGSAR
ncbi:phytanoyl-CoA dioxygenase family protein [Nocardia niwae]|uniref:Phytanoyl-CoA dioxygenase family protein n=1 Tax=Nocardia niwae TaxID=626084 RepID=A0ABV2X726_9NOCA